MQQTRKYGANLRRYRRQNHVSLVELGAELGCAASTISRWERGQLSLSRPEFSRAIAAIDAIVARRLAATDPTEVLD